MRLSKGLVFVVALLLVLPSGVAFGSADIFFVQPPTLDLPNDVDTNFYVTIHMKNASEAASITIPLTFAGNDSLRIDSTINGGGGALGVQYVDLGLNAVWGFKTSLFNNANKNILLGFVSFASLPPDDSGELVQVYFDLNKGGALSTVTIDTTVLPPDNHLSIVDELGTTYYPDGADGGGWTASSLNIGGTGIAGDGSLLQPRTFSLGQNYPNPFNAQTKIDFAIAAPGHVELKVFNVLGQAVKTLINKDLGVDQYSVLWDGTNDQGDEVGSGVFFYRLKVGDSFEKTERMTLLK